EVVGGVFEVLDPVGQRLVQGFLHPGDVNFDGLAAEGLLRGHVGACGCLGEDPLVGAHDALRGAAPQGLGVLGDGVDGGGDGEDAVAGPGEGVTGLERPVQARCGDVGLPGGPVVDVGVQPPDGLQGCADVDLVAGDHRGVAVDAGGGGHVHDAP